MTNIYEKTHTNLKANVKVSFVPSNDVYEIINSNKNESISYVSHEGNVIYWPPRGCPREPV